MIRKFIKFCFIFCLVVGFFSLLVGGGVGYYYYTRLTRDLPQIERIGDYKPKGVTTILSDDGVLMAEVYEERRYPVSFEEIPALVKHAFLAAEDASFYEHPGIDVRGIIRAVYANWRGGGKKQGASTITQQVVKSLLLTREKTFTRKAKEAILSFRLEKSLTKDEILSIYLNEIFLGQTAHGVKAAARVHFQKELEDLTIAEAAYIAALPKQPSRYTKPSNRELALGRQQYVLRQMLQNDFITEDEYQEAKDQELEIFPPESKTYHSMPYFASHAVSVLEDRLRQIDPNLSPASPGGYVVETTADSNVYRLAEKAVRRGLVEVDRRRGWRGPRKTLADDSEIDELNSKQILAIGEELKEGKLYKCVVSEVSFKNKSANCRVGYFNGEVSFAKEAWATKLLKRNKRTGKESTVKVRPLKLLKRGSVIEVSLDPKKIKEGVYTDTSKSAPFLLSQTPQVQAAFSVANALSGEVKAIIGGFDFEKSQFNRATQGELQPGSSFKPFIYLAAVERLGYTPATIVPDSPISMKDGTGEIWSPQNYDRKFIGPITLRTALQRSRNVVSVHLLKRVGVSTGIKYARDLGITTPISRNMSIALGTPEVKLIEMVRAYSTFPAGGYLPDSLIIKSIKDRDGRILYQQHPGQKKVISEESAFLMANMMKGVVERGTAQILKKLERPVAGKTGTTNDQMDAWFIGYTPEWAAGAWVGFDTKRTIGKWETGGKAAAPIFLYFMEEFLKDEPKLDFEIPDGVIPLKINAYTGRTVSDKNPDGFLEYFKIGTEPTHSAQDIELPRDYLASDEF